MSRLSVIHLEMNRLRVIAEQWSFPLRKGNLGVIGGCATITALLLAAFVAPLPYDPVMPDPNLTLEAPSSAHWFGTDSIGRDVFSRVIAGARIDLPLAFAGTALSLGIGVPLGLIVTTKSKWSERIMRGLDMFQAFPLIILAMVLVTLAGGSLAMVAIAIAIIYAPRYIRLVRAEGLVLRESRFIEAAVAIGASPPRIMVRHFLPNMTGIILANTALTISRAIIVIAGLSFLGMGVQPPTASWGSMIQTGSTNMTSGEWWVAAFPGLAVFVCVLIFNQIAEAGEVVLGRGAHG